MLKNNDLKSKIFDKLHKFNLPKYKSVVYSKYKKLLSKFVKLFNFIMVVQNFIALQKSKMEESKTFTCAERFI